MKISSFVLGLVVVFILGCARTPVYKSSWQQPSFVVDGDGVDWEGQMYYDSESGFMYGLSNNSDKLFVRLKVADPAVQRKMMVAGLTLWIDTTGKKKKQLGLTFPVKTRPDRMPRVGESKIKNGNNGQNKQVQTDIVMFNSKYEAGMESMLLTNYFGNGRTDLINNKNTEGINAILRFDEGRYLYYEAELPLNIIFPDPLEFLNDTTKKFSYGFETGQFDMSSFGGQRGGGMARMGGRGGGGSYGGSRSGSTGAGKGHQKDPEKMAMMEELSQPSKLWVKKVVLANQ